MYTQISSETGIPGFCMYMAAVILSFRSMRKIMQATRDHPGLNDIYRLAFAVRVSWILFLVCGFFGSVAYAILVVLLIAISEVLRKAAFAEIEARTRQANAVAARSAAPLLYPPSRLANARVR
jgi:hypothetical protein